MSNSDLKPATTKSKSKKQQLTDQSKTSNFTNHNP